MADDPEVRQVTDLEVDAAYAGAAPGANLFYISLGGGAGVRISFVEQQEGSKKFHFRSAVTLHPSDAIQLHKVLKDLMDPIEKQILEMAEQVDGDA